MSLRCRTTGMLLYEIRVVAWRIGVHQHHKESVSHPAWHKSRKLVRWMILTINLKNFRQIVLGTNNIRNRSQFGSSRDHYLVARSRLNNTATALFHTQSICTMKRLYALQFLFLSMIGVAAAGTVEQGVLGQPIKKLSTAVKKRQNIRERAKKIRDDTGLRKLKQGR
jgi:hypothetical protein